MTNDATKRFSRLVRLVSHPHRTYAAAVLRIGFGTITFLLYAMHFRQRLFLWGPNGQLDGIYYQALSGRYPLALYSWSNSIAWTDFLYIAGMIVSVLFALGIVPRLTSILFYVTTAALYDRNSISLDGGNNVLILLALYLCFADTGKHFALKTVRIRALRRFYPILLRPLNVLHNAAMATIVLQIAMVYFWSGFAKIMGHKWQDGTAIYYIMRVNEFSLPGLSHFIYENALLVTFLTYSTIVFQISFPFMMWYSRLKLPLFIAAIGFHTGVATFMGLTAFSASLIVADIAIFSDAAFLNLVAHVHALGTHARGLFTRKPVAVQTDAA
jgi:vitamin K-dependent gamma-carboxylase-like protein